MRGVFQATRRTSRGALVVTLLGALAVSPLAANDDLILPQPTYPEVARLLDAGDHTAALDRLTATVEDDPNQPDQPIEALVLRATLLAHVGREPDAEAVWRQVIDRAVWMRTFSRRANVQTVLNRPAISYFDRASCDLERWREGSPDVEGRTD